MTTHGVDRSGAAGGQGSAVTPVDITVVDAKGDLIVGTANDAVDNLAVGANDRMLMADSAQTTGIKWATPDQVLQAAINGATAETAPATGDLVGLSDVSATAGRKMTLANLLKVINDLTAETAPAVADLVALYDASGATVDKITLEDLLKVINSLTEDIAPDLAADYVASYDASASGAKRVLAGRLGSGTLGTLQATTSGTAFDFTVPTWAKSIEVTFRGVSLSGTDNLLVQIGTGGAPTTSGYVSTGIAVDNAGGSAGASSTAGFLVSSAAAASVSSGVMKLELHDSASNVWVASFSGKRSATEMSVSGGDVALAGAVNIVRLTRTGTDTFDAGSVNVRYS